VITVVYFAGGGGTCEGLREAGFAPTKAVNHWGVALDIHRANHPETEHCLSDVRGLEPVPGTDLFWQSPDCTHHSKCKGGKPRDNALRGLANVGLDYARAVRPRLVVTENVPEFTSWGPLDENGMPLAEGKGTHFRAWVEGLESLGYAVEWRVLRACDFGAPTTRQRLFVIARLDAAPEWPTPTHGPGLMPYRTARQCIDWSIPTPSIFGRPKPYSEATQRRIARGLKKFGTPNLIQLSQGERVGQAPRIFDLDAPLSTVVAGGVKQGIVCAFVAKHFGGNGSPGSSLDAPLDTITTRDHNALVVARRPSPHAAECRAWLDAHVGVGALPEVEDIGMRPLVPRELARATGLPDSYVINPGGRVGKTDQVRAIGNMVPPAFARAIAEANRPVLAEAAE
jgi:DNA (cytosine-5)-methyltransferase 1